MTDAVGGVIFPFLFGGTFIEALPFPFPPNPPFKEFPFLFGGTFIEASSPAALSSATSTYFPSFSEGLSLRREKNARIAEAITPFPFLFGGTFIEAEGLAPRDSRVHNFPSFSEGLSLRHHLLARSSYPRLRFPFLFGGTFIEAPMRTPHCMEA